MRKNFNNTNQTNSGNKKRWIFKNVRCKFLFVENIPKLIEIKENQEKYSAFYKNLPRLIKFSVFFRDSLKKYEKIFKNKGGKIIFFNLIHKKKKALLFRRNFMNFSFQKKFSVISCQSFIKKKKNKKYFNWLYYSFFFFAKHNFINEQKKKSKKTQLIVKKKKIMFNRNIYFLFSFFNKKMLFKKKNKSFLYYMYSNNFFLADNFFFFHKTISLKLDKKENLVLGRNNMKKDFFISSNSVYNEKKKAKIEFLSKKNPFTFNFIFDKKKNTYPEKISGNFFSYRISKNFFLPSKSNSLNNNLEEGKIFLSKTNKKPINFVEKNYAFLIQFIILSYKKIKKVLSNQEKNFFRVLIFRANYKEFIIFDKDLDLLFVLFFRKKKFFIFDHIEGILNLERKRERKKSFYIKNAKEHIKILFLIDIKVLNNSKKNLNFPSFYLEFLMPEFKVLIEFISYSSNFSRIAFFKNSSNLLSIFHDLISEYRKNWYKKIGFFFRKKPVLEVWFVRKSKNFTKNFHEWYNNPTFQQRKIPRMIFNKKKRDYILFDSKKWTKNKMPKNKFKNCYGQTHQKFNTTKKLKNKIKNPRKRNKHTNIKKKLSQVIKGNFKIQIQKNCLKTTKIEGNKHIVLKKKPLTDILLKGLNSKNSNQNQSIINNMDLFSKIGFVLKNSDFTPMAFFLNYKTILIFSSDFFLRSILERNYSVNSTLKFITLDLLFLGKSSKTLFSSEKYFNPLNSVSQKKIVKKKKIRKLINSINFFEVNIKNLYDENTVNAYSTESRIYVGKKEEISFLTFLYLLKNESKLNIFHLKNKIKYVIDIKLKYRL